ncbi:MAG: SEC-C metal-binding domain-containing protein [Lentisphaeria bacterium]
MRIPQDLKSSPIFKTERAKQSKPGRNVPCPCGSGKKYKECCGR